MHTTDDLSLYLNTPEETEEAPETEAPEEIEAEEETPVTDDEGEGDETPQEDDTDDEAEADEQPEQMFTVKVDGEDREVTLEELTRSFAGQGYIQKRMQENATKAREVEELYGYLQQERAQMAQLYQQFQSGDLLAPPKAPDASLREKDPLRYMRERDAYEQQKTAYDQQQTQMQQLTTQQSQAQQQAMQAYQAEQMRELAAKLPEIADPEKGAILARKLSEAATSYGFAPDEVGQISDHRALLILHDAMKYRATQEQREKVQAKVEKARPIVKPTAQRSAELGRKKQADAARSKMKQTGDITDWLLTPSKS